MEGQIVRNRTIWPLLDLYCQRPVSSSRFEMRQNLFHEQFQVGGFGEIREHQLERVKAKIDQLVQVIDESRGVAGERWRWLLEPRPRPGFGLRPRPCEKHCAGERFAHA